MAEDNRKNFNVSMDPSKLLAVYTKQQELCPAFAANARNSTCMADMVQTGVTHAVAMGVKCKACCEWKHIPKLKQTWNQWKEHFNDAFNELKELNAITSESMRYGASNITEQAVAPNVAMALDNLAFVGMSKTDPLDTLVAAMKYLADGLAHIAKDNEKLLNMVSHLTTDAPKPKQLKQGIPNNYCWTHGFVMSLNRNSKTCNNKAPGH